MVNHEPTEKQPLQGITVAVTSSRRAPELAKMITSLGGIPYLAATVGIEARPSISEETKSFIKRILAGVDYAVFMTGPGVYSLMSAAVNLGVKDELIETLRKAIVVARSPKPKRALAEYDIPVHILPEENTAKGIAKELKGRSIAGKSLAIIWHGSYSPHLKSQLEASGAEVLEASTYTYSTELKESGAKILKSMGFNYVAPEPSRVIKLIEDISAGHIDAVTFTSPPAASNLFKLADANELKEPLKKSLNRSVIVVAVGPSTSQALEAEGVHVDVTPTLYKMGPMIKALCDFAARNAPAKKRFSTSPYGVKADAAR